MVKSVFIRFHKVLKSNIVQETVNKKTEGQDTRKKNLRVIGFAITFQNNLIISHK
jgi:hypothetical protein